MIVYNEKEDYQRKSKAAILNTFESVENRALILLFKANFPFPTLFFIFICYIGASKGFYGV